MPSLRAITVLVFATALALGGGVYFGDMLTPTSRVDKRTGKNRTVEQTPASERTVFVLDHQPIVCRDWNKPVTFEVPIINSFDETVRFKNFACDCGCTSAQYDRQELQPQETAVVRMTVDLSGREGNQRFVCRWTDQNDRRWSSEVRVAIFRPAQFDSKVIHLGQVSPGDAIKKQINYDEYATVASELSTVPSFSISAIQGDSIKLTVGQSTMEPFADGVHRRRTSLDVGIVIPNRIGFGECTVTPTANQQSINHLPSMHLDWKVQETVELIPARLALTFKADTDEEQTRLVKIRSLVQDTAAIEKITTTDSSISARVLSSGKSAADYLEVEVRVKLPQSKRLLAGDVVLHLIRPISSELRIPITAVRLEGSNVQKNP
jgi:hypothetical protein